MKFKIDSRIFEKFPQLNVGVIICKGIDNRGEPEEVIRLIREREEEIRSGFRTETLSQDPKINAWREAYRSFGAKPKEHRGSVENLYRRIIKGEETRHINKIVDIYNFISVKHMVPAGGEDLDKTQGDIHLTLAGKDEKPVLLLGDKDPRPPHEGEVIYRDEESAICRRFNWREADRTKFEEETKNAVLIAEGLPPVTKEGIEAILKEMKELVQKFCGGEVSSSVLNKDKQEIEF